VLIGKGASTDLLNNAKCTALFVAVSQGFTEVVRTLCELNCDVNLPVSLGFCGTGGRWCVWGRVFEVGRCCFVLHHLLLCKI